MPQLHVEGTYRLGNWVSMQRKNREITSAERITRLNKIGFLWCAEIKDIVQEAGYQTDN